MLKVISGLVGRSYRVVTRSARLAVIVSLIGVGGITLEAAAPVLEGRLAVEQIELESGYAYTAPINARVRFPFKILGDDTQPNGDGRLTLLENGVALGPGGTIHSVIRKDGGGLFSHWGNKLHFSASDRISPLKNGRTYTYRVRASLDPTVRAAAWVVAVVGMLGLGTSGALANLRRTIIDRLTGRGKRFVVVGRVGLLLGVVSIAVLAVQSIPGPVLRGTLHADKIRPIDPIGFRARVDARPSWPFELAGQSWAAPASSLPMLFEDGRPLGRSASTLEDLSKAGNRRVAFSHGEFVFPSSDGSDPSKNGRIYTWELPQSLKPSAWAMAFFLLAVSWVFLRHAVEARRPGRDVIRFGPDRVGTIGLGVVLAFLPLGMLLYQWREGISGHLGFLGYFPMSDAAGYFHCSVALTGVGSPELWATVGDWCGRRMLYPALLGTIQGLAGWRPQVVLVAQAMLIGAAIAVMFAAARVALGYLAAGLMALGLLAFAWEYAVGVFMTEVAGFVCGMAGLAFLVVHGVDPIRRWPLWFGLALISAGLSARAGALFVIPFLAIWAALVMPRHWSRLVRARELSLCLLALAAGPAMQVGLLVSNGQNVANSGGNFGPTLYGLSTGSRDWAEAYRVYATDFAQQKESAVFAIVRTAAIKNIIENPAVFVDSLLVAGATFFKGMFGFGYGLQKNALLTGLLAMGTMFAAMRWRTPVFSLLLAFLLGESISAPAIIDSGGHRVFAATVGARLLLAGLGLAALAAIVREGVGAWRTFGREFTPSGQPRVVANAAAILGSLLVLGFLIPATPLVRMMQWVPERGVWCPQGTDEVVVRLGRDSMLMGVGAQRKNPIVDGALVVPPGRIEADPVAGQAWWLDQFGSLGAGEWLIYAIQHSPTKPGEKELLRWSGSAPVIDGAHPTTLCVDPKPSGETIAENPVRRIVEIR